MKLKKSYVNVWRGMGSKYNNYSRLARLQEKENLRNSVIFLTLTFLFVLIIILFGIKVITSVIGFIGNSDPINISDNTPPPPPNFLKIVEFTNKSEITIEGNSEAGATITLKLNDEKKELITDNQGKFNTSFSLKKGTNTISGSSKDTSGNESVQSKTIQIIYDDEKPKIELTSITEGQQISGKDKKQINVEGTTEVGSSVTINGRIIDVNSEGKFTMPTTLSEGENSFNIKSTDRAGNMEEVTIKVTYSP